VLFVSENRSNAHRENPYSLNPVNNGISEWNKDESYSKGMFGTVIGQLHDKVLSACRQDKSRWSAIEADNDLISLISMLEKICAQNMTGNKVFIPYGNLFTIKK
jgi:hypothetical protein